MKRDRERFFFVTRKRSHFPIVVCWRNVSDKCWFLFPFFRPPPIEKLSCVTLDGLNEWKSSKTLAYHCWILIWLLIWLTPTFEPIFIIIWFISHNHDTLSLSLWCVMALSSALFSFIYLFQSFVFLCLFRMVCFSRFPNEPWFNQLLHEIIICMIIVL